MKVDRSKRLAFVIVAVVVSAHLALVEETTVWQFWGWLETPGMYIALSLFQKPGWGRMVAGPIADSYL